MMGTPIACNGNELLIVCERAEEKRERGEEKFSCATEEKFRERRSKRGRWKEGERKEEKRGREGERIFSPLTRACTCAHGDEREE